MDQNTQEWLKMRKNYIGASDAPVIMGKCKFKLSDGRFKTPNLLWQEKLGLLNANSDNEATRYGKRMEDPARQAYEAQTGILMVPDVVFHPSIKYMMASLDGLSMDKDMAVEIKNANAEDHAAAREKRVPEHYYPQLQHQLDCLYKLYNIDMMHYYSFHKREGIIVEVKRDISYLEILHEKEREFWECVESMEEPELTDLDFQEMDKNWELKAKKLWELEESIKQEAKLAKELKDELKNLSRGLNSKSGDFRFVYHERKGNIDYSLVPELANKDLECYRKPPTKIYALQRGR
jgi:putative phage-type endonuclease